MELHELSNTPGARQTRKRVGRGESSGWGKTCGKGHKGQMARAGHKRKPGFEGGQMPLMRRLPKRGFNSAYGIRYAPVQVADLKVFDADATVGPAELVARGLIRGPEARVKVLGKDALDRKLTVRAQAFSAGARAAIEAAGGRCETID